MTSVASAAKEPRDPVAPRQLPTLLGPNLQPLLAIESVGSLAIDDKTLPPQQGMQPQEAIAAILRRKNLQPVDNCRIVFRQRPVLPNRPRQADDPAAAPLAQTPLGYRPQLCAWPGALPIFASSSFIADISSN